MKDKTLQKLISSNKKARYDYFLSNHLEVGIVLIDNEIKQILQHGINLKESYVKIIKNEVFLVGSNIHGINFEKIKDKPVLLGAYNQDTRDRKLLLHKKEINKFKKLLQDQSTTLVCTKCYVNDNGLVKLEIALGKGKKLHDKRETIKKRDLDRYK